MNAQHLWEAILSHARIQPTPVFWEERFVTFSDLSVSIGHIILLSALYPSLHLQWASMAFSIKMIHRTSDAEKYFPGACVVVTIRTTLLGSGLPCSTVAWKYRVGSFIQSFCLRQHLPFVQRYPVPSLSESLVGSAVLTGLLLHFLTASLFHIYISINSTTTYSFAF